MKRLYTLLFAILLSASIWAQVPQKMSYQAVIRNAAGELITEQQIGVRISILQGSASGSQVYSETQTPTTNTNGLISIEFGGTAFQDINWADGPYFIKTETDPTGGSNYTIMGVSQILSVPYAFHAQSAEVLTGAIAETDPIFNAWDKSTGIEITENQISDLKLYLTEETDPVFAANIDTAGAIEGHTLRYDGSKFVSAQQQMLSINGRQLSLSDGNTITLPTGTTGASNIAILTVDEIMNLTPEQGESVFNKTQNFYQIFTGTEWVSIPANCWPQPTPANAGPSQNITDDKTSTLLAANAPLQHFGTGQWTIVSGNGGSFEDTNDPKTTFTGQECTSYQLKWTITTSCSSSESNTIVAFNHTPTIANAGANQKPTDGTTTLALAGNTPVEGIGKWTIISGEGGNFADIHDPKTLFTGQAGQRYTLQWSIETSCATSTDETTIAFTIVHGAGVTDIDGNFYPSVIIGNQEWMAENLKTTKYSNGTPIDYPGSNDSDWQNNTTGAYAWHDNDISWKDSYGALYNWHTVNNNNGLCPNGWHVPSDDEWTELVYYLGTQGYPNEQDNPNGAGNALKSCRQESSPLGGECAAAEHPRWDSHSTHFGTDEFGFSALPGGVRYSSGSYLNVGGIGTWWSATEFSSADAWFRILGGNGNLNRSNSFGHKVTGFSVRCLRDN